MFPKYSDTTAIFVNLWTFPFSNLNKFFCGIRECFMKALANSADLEQSLGAVLSWSTILAVSEYLG